MHLLLDTHTLIWHLRADADLSETAKEAITDLNNTCSISAASLWEIAIKVGIGKIHFKFPFSDFAPLMAKNDFEWLPINFEHTQLVSSLPSYHRDPFDRMLIAQAIAENLTVVTKDPNFGQYGVETLW